MASHTKCAERSMTSNWRHPSPVHVYHAHRDHQGRCQSHPITDRVPNSQSDRVFLQFSTMRHQPGSAEPIKNDGTEQKKKFRRGVEQAHLRTVNIEAEDDDGGKTAADAEREQKLA